MFLFPFLRCLTFFQVCFGFSVLINIAAMKESFTDLSIGEEEEAPLPVGSGRPGGGLSYKHCFEGSFLTSSVIHFQSM